VAAQTVSADLDANGSISVDLAATDEPGTSPRGNTYCVIESIEGQPRRTYSIEVPHDATNQTIDLADVAPAFDSAVTSRAPSPHSLLGQHHSDPNSYRRDDTPIVLGAGAMAVIEGAPSITAISNRWAAYAFSDNNDERVGGIINVPYQWAALDIELWYTTKTGNSGDARVRDRRLAPNEGEDLKKTSSSDKLVSVSTPVEHLATHTLTKDAPVSDSDSSPIGPGPMLLTFERRPNVSSDTLSGDLLVIALVLRKAG
jgi:hypothetical protein